jgi:hypothetical protein
MEKESSTSNPQTSRNEITIKFSNKIEKLREGNWTKWSREVKMSLRAQKAWKYVVGEVPEPKEKEAKKEWNEINDQIVGALGTIVDEPLQHAIDDITNAKSAWDKLKEKTQAKGLVGKLENMQTAIKTRFNQDIPFSKTITQIRDSIDAVFDPTPPTKDEWLTILLMNALGEGEFEWLRKILLSFLTTSKSQLTAEDVIKRIEAESREQERTEDSAMAMKAKTTKRKPKAKCNVCQRPGHTAEGCWEEGGGAEGSAPSWWKKGKCKGDLRGAPKTQT